MGASSSRMPLPVAMSILWLATGGIPTAAATTARTIWRWAVSTAT